LPTGLMVNPPGTPCQATARKERVMKKSGHRTATVVAGAPGALVLALPLRSSARPYHHSHYSQDSGRGRPDERAIKREDKDLEQGRAAQRRDWDTLQKERQEMNQARRAGDQGAYQQDLQEAREAKRALQRDNAQIRQDKRELRQDEQALRHDRNE